MNERGIDRKTILNAINIPDKIEISKINFHRFLVKKLYYNNEFRGDRLLIIICEEMRQITNIITIIDTSKISKYF